MRIADRINSLRNAKPDIGDRLALDFLEQVQRTHGDQMIPVTVSGSTNYDWHSGQMKTAVRVLGSLLGDIPSVILLTGGMPAVGEDIGEQFGAFDRLYHLLPSEHALGYPKFGNVLIIGDSYQQRQVVLGKVASIVVIIGGGPGTCREANASLLGGGVVFPFACTGGAASGMEFQSPDEWGQRIDLTLARQVALDSGIMPQYHYDALCDPTGSPSRAARIVYTAIQSALAEES